MAKNWNYAELSKAAKAAGGPERFVEQLENTAKKEGKMEIAPWIGIAVVGGIFLYKGIRELIDYFKLKRAKNQRAIDEAKKEIIAGIKEYDAVHENEGKK